MTFIMAMRHRTCAIILSDRACLDSRDKTFCLSRMKTAFTPGGCVAVSGAGWVAPIIDFSDDLIASVSRDVDLFSLIKRKAEEIGAKYGAAARLAPGHFSCVAVSYDALNGGRIFKFSAEDFVVHEVRSWVNDQDLSIIGEDAARYGLLPRKTETQEAWARRCGADIFEIMRMRREASGLGGSIGGGVDLTVIDASGARHIPLRTWRQDKIGRPLKPLRKGPVPLLKIA